MWRCTTWIMCFHMWIRRLLKMIGLFCKRAYHFNDVYPVFYRIASCYFSQRIGRGCAHCGMTWYCCLWHDSTCDMTLSHVTLHDVYDVLYLIVSCDVSHCRDEQHERLRSHCVVYDVLYLIVSCVWCALNPHVMYLIVTMNNMKEWDLIVSCALSHGIVWCIPLFHILHLKELDVGVHIVV